MTILGGFLYFRATPSHHPYFYRIFYQKAIQLLGTHIFGNLGTSSEAKVDTVEPDEPVEPDTVEPETGGRGWRCVPKIVPWRMWVSWTSLVSFDVVWCGLRITELTILNHINYYIYLYNVVKYIELYFNVV